MAHLKCKAESAVTADLQLDRHVTSREVDEDSDGDSSDEEDLAGEGDVNGA